MVFRKLQLDLIDSENKIHINKLSKISNYKDMKI